MWLVATTAFSYFISGGLQVYTAILPLGGTTATFSLQEPFKKCITFMNQDCSIHFEVWLSAFCLDPIALATCFTHFGNT